jgi:hypothetical protein
VSKQRHRELFSGRRRRAAPTSASGLAGARSRGGPLLPQALRAPRPSESAPPPAWSLRIRRPAVHRRTPRSDGCACQARRPRLGCRTGGINWPRNTSPREVNPPCYLTADGLPPRRPQTSTRHGAAAVEPPPHPPPRPIDAPGTFPRTL